MGLFSFSNLELLDTLYQNFKTHPESVDLSWRCFFEGWEQGQAGERSDLRLPLLIEAYRLYGHLAARINPLEEKPTGELKQLSLEAFGFKKSDLERQVSSCGFLKDERVSLGTLVEALQKTYCGFIGVEYKGIVSPEIQEWLQKKMEPYFSLPFSSSERCALLHDLNRAELFEAFLHTKYVGQKRFSLEGAETLIPLLKKILEGGIKEVVIGMSHRGRLNVLANILNKAYAAIFEEFEDFYTPGLTEGTGDVKYHKGFTGAYVTSKGERVAVVLANNPSHLESVDPVVEGMVRAKQLGRSSTEVLPLLIHGDAAVAGQGVVYETLQLSKLRGYGTGGTIHIVINNQIGFTTLPKDSRSTPYCTDIAKAFGAPIFHVNAERPEECVYAAQLALELRQKFQCDVFLDLVCYRKYGHNEGDEPAFTQPLEYKQIRAKKGVRFLYQENLLKQNILTQEAAEKLEEEFRETLATALTTIKTKTPIENEPKKSANQAVDTAAPAPLLVELAEDFCQVPAGFHLNPKIVRLLEERLKMVHGETSVDWGMAEHLAYASLLAEGIEVRLSGQDSRRGTFSQRHAFWVDQEQEEKKYFPLSHLKKSQALFDVYNSPLSEMAVLAFEFGYSLCREKALVLWEAQYGDFANGAQVIIDQYISSAEQKWGAQSSLTLLLPHGYEGQGPEHSSARLERYLQLAGHENFYIVNCTTPAQLFHCLRRQAKRVEKKPLILFTPKALLRHPECVSSLNDFSAGTFEPFLEEKNPRVEAPTVLFCTGKIYYDLLKARADKACALIRIEQLYPFDKEKFTTLLKKYGKGETYKWVQEEPQNMGAWSYIQPLLGKELHYVGREASASPAVGSHTASQLQQARLLEEAFK